MELRILSLNFLFYSLSGFWRPVQWTSKLSKTLYGVFTFISGYLTFYMFVTHFMYIIFVVETLNDLASCCFHILAIVNLISKELTVVTRRNRLINLIEMLQEDPCKPCDKEETDIQLKYDYMIRSYSMPYIIICSMSMMNCWIGGVLFMLEGQIPYGLAWVPWDCSSFFIFFLTSIQVMLGTFLAIFVNIATETSILGFCLQICARFEILKYRLQKMINHNEWENISSFTNKTSRLAKHVSHHLYIIRLAEMINDIFDHVIFFQFSTSILILCSTLYHLSLNSVLLDVLVLSAFTVCIFLQIFFYCWGANEVMLKSVEFGKDIYDLNWILMTNSERKDLLIIMKRSAKPIKFSSSFLITLSLESYTNLMKASFSAFNLMQQL
ncbi:hypothetical protein PUN28_012106 [Cardiocondyla obscurior]|uniref:Odorant receptor n=1 Tax=Cardiocondyla obscurior TaxID=286306 RepID=A0AAW2FF28_9HYME